MLRRGEGRCRNLFEWLLSRSIFEPLWYKTCDECSFKAPFSTAGDTFMLWLLNAENWKFCKNLDKLPSRISSSSLFQQHAWSHSGETGLYSQRINNIVMTQLLTGNGLYQLKHEKPSCRLSHVLNPSCIPETPLVPHCCENTPESTNTGITYQGY